MADVDLWDEVLIPFGQKVAERVRVSIPGVVEMFNRATQRATVVWRSPFRQGATNVQDEPKGVDLPVCFHRAGLYVSMSMDLDPDDPVLSVTGDRTQNRFWTDGQGEASQFADPHNRSYSVVLPGGRYSQDGPINEPGEALSGAEDGSATLRFRKTVGSNLGLVRCQAAGGIEVDAGETVTATAGTEMELTAATVVTVEAPEIKLGATAVKGVVLDQDPVSPDANFITMITAISGVVNTVAPGTITPAQLLAFQTQMGSVTSTAVKAKAE